MLPHSVLTQPSITISEFAGTHSGTVLARTSGMPRPCKKPHISSSLMPGGSGAVAPYGMTLSPPRQMAIGMRCPSFFQLRQCEAPSWCMCQCMASDVGPSNWLRYMPML